jgi:hypothetical protein
MNSNTKNINIKRSFEQFGALQINMSKLLKGKLYVAYATGSPFLSIKQNSEISNAFADTIAYIIDNDALPQDSIDMMDMKESELFNTLMTYSHLDKKYRYKHKKADMQTLKDRFIAIQGMIEAGNDSSELLDEGLFICKLLHASGIISDEQYKTLIEN